MCWKTDFPNGSSGRRVSLVWVAIVGILFWMQSFQKIHYTDIWGHVEYGRLLWETGKIPATEPLMPLSAGMPFVDTAWGSQVLAYLTQAKFGPAGIQFLHAPCRSRWPPEGCCGGSRA